MKVARRATIWSAVALAALVGPGIAVADQVSPEFGRGGRHAGPGLSLDGRAMSQTGERQGYAIAVRARSVEEGKAQGWVRFGSKTAEKAEGFEGQVRCLSRDAAGVVQLSGTIRRSGASANDSRREQGEEPKPADSNDPAAFLTELFGPEGPEGGPQRGGQGGQLDGKDFALTIDVPGDPQRFSAAKVADAGTLPACSAGEGAGLAVTRGGFRTTISEGS